MLTDFNLYKNHFLILFSIGLCIASCKKDWLDAKPVSTLVVPGSVQDYQALLDNTSNSFNNNQPALGELASDAFYLTYINWQRLNPIEQNVYLWLKNPYDGSSNSDWNLAYAQILNTNVVLDGLKNVQIDSSNNTAWNNVKGSALFFRGFSYYNLTQIFCKQYDSTSSNSNLGLPLRLSSIVTIKSTSRASLETTYSQILADIKTSISLLPVTPVYPTRPSQPAAYALLARIYLSRRDYNNAFLYSDSALHMFNSLLDFNSLDTNSFYPIPIFSNEVIFHSVLAYYRTFYPLVEIADSNLYASYDTNDLRRLIYIKNYQGTRRLWGNFGGGLTPPAFGGFATDEIYLIRAESEARLGNMGTAMNDLNTLLMSRYVTGTFQNRTATDPTDALTQILNERKKELILRGLRWSDLRRLNSDPRFAITLKRVLNGQTYTLAPNDSRYVFPIPPDELRLSGIQQNP